MLSLMIMENKTPYNPYPEKLKNTISAISIHVFIMITAEYFFIMPNTRNEPRSTILIESRMMKGTASLMMFAASGSLKMVFARMSDEKKKIIDRIDPVSSTVRVTVITPCTILSFDNGERKRKTASGKPSNINGCMTAIVVNIKLQTP